MSDCYRRMIDFQGQKLEVLFKKRPFREGMEAVVTYAGETIRIGELGLGEEALLEKLRTELSRLQAIAKSETLCD